MENLFPLGDFESNTITQSQPNQNQMHTIDFNGFNRDYFMNNIVRIEIMDESELIMLIKNHIDIIVDRTLSDEKSMGSILSHPKFVAAYSKAIQMIPIDAKKRLFINKLTYEYSIIDNPDQNLLDQFRSVSKFVNKDITNKLIAATGLSNHIANDLVACRFSSIHESTNIERLNFNICKYNDAGIFTEQIIIFIYEQLFNNISELFITSMLEVYSDKELDDLGMEFREIYGNISLAILTILNNMPKKDIRTVILRYIDSYHMSRLWPARIPPRFTLRALSQDYARIVYAVELLINEGYDIP